MTAQLQSLLDSAMRLSAEERAELAGSLLQSLPASTDNGVDEAWTQEIAKRSREIDAGQAVLIPWREVRDEARRRLQARDE